MENDDWLLASIEQVERAGERAQTAIGEVVAAIEQARDMRTAGVPVSAIVDGLIAGGGRQTRLRSAAAVDELEHTIMVFRVGLIRALVDDEKLSFTEVGRRIEVSRQMVAKLYRYGESPGFPDVCRTMGWP